MSSSRIWGLVPARAGSKGLPGKNTRAIAGRPMVGWTIDAARASCWIDELLVTTDDAAVKVLAQAAGATVVDRPAELAGDDAPIVETVLHAAEVTRIASDDVVVLLQPTSPLRTAADIDAALALFFETADAGSVMSVCDVEHHPLKMLLVRTDGALATVSRDAADLAAARQALPPAFRQNGAVYVVRLAGLCMHRSFFVPRCLPLAMPPARSIDVDDLASFETAARALERGTATSNDASRA